MLANLPVQYIHGATVTYPPGATFGPRTMRDFEFVWIIRGNVTYHVNDRDIPAPPGTVVLARPGFRDAFTWDRQRETRHAFFHFNAPHFPADLGPVADWPIARTLADGDIVRPLFRYVLSMCEPPGQRRQEPTVAHCRAVELLLSAFVVGPLSQAPDHDRDLPRPVVLALAHIRKQLDTNPEAAMSLDDLAAAASVSSEHLCRQFRAALEVGPMEAARTLRLDMALGLLARSNLSVSEVAYRCGFTSPDHFSRRFNQLYGLPPGAMRKAIRQGKAPPTTTLVRYAR